MSLTVAFPTSKTTEPIAGYTVKERIGAGGYGEVWRAEAPGGLHKAIKFVYGYLDDERAARELKALNRIKEVRHPFLLSLDRIEVVDGQLVIITELADASLKDRFEECKQAGLPGVPRDELLIYLRDAADALDHMSEQYSLQHLDIKPENLLIVGGRVKVADFGLVKDIHDTTVSLMGGLTPVYAPPEVFDGRPSLHSDQYSLAIVYQEMLTGALPFPGKTASQLAVQHLNSPPRLAPLPASDRAMVARALSKDPDQRFPSCRAMVEALLEGGRSSGEQRSPGEGEGSAAPDVPEDAASVTYQATELYGLPKPAAPSDRPSSGPGAPVCETMAFGESAAPAFAADTDSDAPPSALRRSDSQVKPPESFPPKPEAPAPVEKMPPIDLDPEACGIRPTLVLGIGGTAARTLCHLRRRLHDRFGDVASVPALRLLLIDTNCKAITQATQGDERGALSSAETLAVPLRSPQHYRSQSHKLLAWLSRRWLYNIPRSLQTEGLRPLGRLAFVDHAPELFERLRDALRSITAPDALAASSTHTGLPVRSEAPRVFVVSSISGGTGGGMVLDVAYAVRRALADLGLSDEGVCSLLAHSTDRNPRESDLAAANAYACLSELYHYTCASHYPGDPACGLPASADDNAAFRDVYLLHLGSELDDAGFDAATDTLAEYLYLDAVTASGAFFDACREQKNGSAETASPQMNLRTFGMWNLGGSLDALLSGAVELLCRDVLQRWRGAVHRGSRPQRTAMAARPAEHVGQGPDTPLSPDQIDRLARQRAEELQLDLDTLTQWAFKFIARQLGEDPDAYFSRLLKEVLDGQKRRGKGAVVGPLADQILQSIDAVLGPRQEPDGPQEGPPPAFQIELHKQFEEVGRQYQDSVARWILKLVESPKLGATGARRAADWFARHLQSLQSKADQLQKGVTRRLAELERSLTSPRPADQARSLIRRALGGGRSKTPSLEEQWLDYCLMRLHSSGLGGVSKFLRSAFAQVSAVGDTISGLQQRLGGIAETFRPPDAWPNVGLGRDAASSLFDQVRQRVAHKLSGQMPQLVPEVDQEFRAEFFGKHGGVCDIRKADVDFRSTLPPALRHVARKAVLRTLRQIDLTQILLPSHDDELSDQRLRDCLHRTKPPLSVCGGARRLLLVLPEGSSDKPFRESIQRHLTQEPSVLFDRDFDAVLCCEMGGLPLATAMATLIDYRIDYAQVASRLHTRVDVSWQSPF